MGLSRGKIILILVMMSVTISLLVYSFAFTTLTTTGTTSSYLTVSGINFGLNDSTTSINLGSQEPTLDKFGVANVAFTFSISNTGTTVQGYTVRLVDGSSKSTISNKDIRYELTVNGVAKEVKTLSDGGAIDSGTLPAGSNTEYSIKVWLSYDSTMTNGVWNKVVTVEAGTTNIDKSGANEPLLPSNMIPVYYDEDADTWRKADVYNANTDYQWYDYDANMWANAVTVTEASRDNYLGANNGDEVLMSDILSFFVWIPRYKYTIFENTTTKELIDVSFERGIDDTGTVTCSILAGNQSCVDLINGTIVKGKSTLVHPAFTFNGESLTGIWISKFEVSALENSACYTYPSATNCNVNTLGVTSKPNQKSLTYISISNLFKNIRKMELSGNIHGFANTGTTLGDDGIIASDNNNLDIHSIKSFEMGSLMYLTYSKYGKFSDNTYQDDAKDIFNKTSTTQTGSSYYEEKTYAYNVPYYGYGGSTTGNVYGVYDLGGTAYEFVMGNVLTSSGGFTVSSSGFSNTLSNIYYDAYSYRTSTLMLNSHYGDGMLEFKNWLTTSNSLYSTYPFAIRNSVLQTGYSNGSYSANTTGRAVIIVNQDTYITKW